MDVHSQGNTIIMGLNFYSDTRQTYTSHYHLFHFATAATRVSETMERYFWDKQKCLQLDELKEFPN